MSSLYIVIPAYNESENIEKTIDQWYQVVERHNDEGKSIIPPFSWRFGMRSSARIPQMV